VVVLPTQSVFPAVLVFFDAAIGGVGDRFGVLVVRGRRGSSGGGDLAISFLFVAVPALWGAVCFLCSL
jgi:hypothetical protein